MVDMGYDVEDHKVVDPLFGDIEDYKKLLAAAKEKGLKLIIDFVPNHSSDLSVWFKLSEQRIEPYTDYYVWRDAKPINATHSTVPNNWRCRFGGSAWEWNEKRQQYYLHQFAVQQPDLNYRSANVRKEMEDVLLFWLDLGVDGFRVDAPQMLFEGADFEDEPPNPDFKGGDNDAVSVLHIYTDRQPENYELIQSWRRLLDECSKKDGVTRVMCTEDYVETTELVKYFGNSSSPGSHVPFYLLQAYADHEWNATTLDQYVHAEIDIYPKGSYNWVLDNHDNPRSSARFCEESMDSWNMLTLLMPGVASIYYGSELGMLDMNPRHDQRQDPLNGAGTRSDPRDSSRAPMLWDHTKNAGFTTADKPWLPVHPNYWRGNVKSQEQDPSSHLNIFKR
nr:PREDICTED: probable maltase [Bemisia tabaci]